MLPILKKKSHSKGFVFTYRKSGAEGFGHLIA